MNLIYHPLQFLGYVEDGTARYAKLKQQIECLSKEADVAELSLFGFENGTVLRELLYQVPTSHNDFEVILEHHPEARIIRCISHEPILSTAQLSLVSRRLLDISPFIERQLVRYKGTVYLDKTGLPVYAQNKLMLSSEFSDQDYRISVTDAALQTGEPAPVLAFTE